MNEEDLKNIKEYYENLKSKKAYYINIKKQLERLEQTKTVQKYLDLLEKTKNYDFQKMIDYKDDALLDMAFQRNLSSIKDTSKIYVYLGTFVLSDECDIVHGPYGIRVKYDDERADYRKYKDLESYFAIEMPIKKCADFEKENTIIFPSVLNLESSFNQVQRDYLQIALEKGLEKARKHVLTKKY